MSLKANMQEAILCVGKKKGEFDFSVCATVQSLSPSDMQEFRAMIVAAIGTMEDMWRRRQSAKQDVQASSDCNVFPNCDCGAITKARL